MSQNNIYKAFGLNWESKNLVLSELLKEEGKNLKVDVKIINEDSNLWPKINTSKYETPFLNFFNNEIRLKIRGLVNFRISKGNQISFSKENNNVKSNDVKTFLLGSVFGAILIQRNLLVLHGNALEKNGKAIICAGPTGAGKSTLAYALVKKGWKLLSDDLVVVNDDLEVLPGIPRIKLWQDATKAFKINTKNLSRVRDKIEKFIWEPAENQISRNQVKLSKIFVLSNQTPTKLEEDVITRIESEKISILMLRNNSFRPRFVKGLNKEGENFLKLAKLQKILPIYKMNLPKKISEMNSWLKENDLLNIN